MFSSGDLKRCLTKPVLFDSRHEVCALGAEDCRFNATCYRSFPSFLCMCGVVCFFFNYYFLFISSDFVDVTHNRKNSVSV